MRTSEIKIDGIKKEAILTAGGPGFKIYTVLDLDGWVLSLGRRTSFVADNTPAAQVIADYVNLHYHSFDLQESIRNKFNDFIGSLKESFEAPKSEASIH
jgi:hypothetical protein